MTGWMKRFANEQDSKSQNDPTDRLEDTMSVFALLHTKMNVIAVSKSILLDGFSLSSP